MKQHAFILLAGMALFSCKKNYEAPVPDTRWDIFDDPAAVPLQGDIRQKMEGVYNMDIGTDVFGPMAALKWSYTAEGKDTTYHLTFFCEKQVSYFICEGKRRDSSILLNGYWRKMVNTETGKARFTITAANGAAALLRTGPLNGGDSLIVNGVYGTGDNLPGTPIRLRYLRPLYKARHLEIVAHRGGGSTADLLPASENSVHMIKLAASFGATGIETDVRKTKDGVLVLFHDATLNERLIQKNGLVGPIENYTYDQLSNLVRLIHGEHIPTLQEALEAVVYATPLHYVWLDTKFTGSLQPLRDLQAAYMQKAAAIGKDLEITIGIPDQPVLQAFLALPGYRDIPSVCELDPDYVEKANSRIWGPRFTLGLQNETVDRLHAQGRRAFVWTLDIPENVYEYMTQGRFDGILSNYPSIVAYYYYVQP